MTWNWRVVVIVPAAAKEAAEEMARSIDPYGPDYTGEAFALGLSADGSAPVTHYGLYTSATDEMVAGMGAALPQMPAAQYWRHDVDGLLVASNVTEPAGQPWGWPQSLDAAGLRVVPEPA
jgi:hypothetical protein